MTDPQPCRVIGVLDDGAASLSPTALALLRRADWVIGGARTLALLDDDIAPHAQRCDLTGQLSAVPGWIAAAREAGQSSVVLATGDPLCHGIASYLASRLCIEAVEVLPNLSTVQLACARLGLAWQDARIVSVHSKDAGEWRVGAEPGHGLYALAQSLRQHDRLLVLTSPDNTPDRIARLMVAEGLGDDFQMAVAERLCTPDERVVAELSPHDAAQQTFADPNVVVLVRSQVRPQPVRMGLADSAYHQRQPDKGLITKQEVRAVSLAGFSIPTYWLGLIAILTFFYALDLSPAPMGRLDATLITPERITGSYFIDALLRGQWEVARSALSHLLLPVMTVAVVACAPIMKHTRAIASEIVDSEFIRFARSSGLGERRIRGMVLRNSMVPVLTFLGTEIVGLLGTSSLIELIFSWGGIGQWGLQSILNGDFAAIQGYVLFAALLSVVVFIIIDAANYILEPRGRERM